MTNLRIVIPVLSKIEYEGIGHRLLHRLGLRDFVDYLNSITPLEDDGNKSRIFYNEDRLYTVHDREHGTVTLVVADSPREARDKVLKGANQDV